MAIFLYNLYIFIREYFWKQAFNQNAAITYSIVKNVSMFTKSQDFIQIIVKSFLFNCFWIIIEPCLEVSQYLG